MKNKKLEEGEVASVDFLKLKNFYSKGGDEKEKNVIPVVVQDFLTKEVLILAYVNEESLNYSLRNKVAVFWSTSKNMLWIKGSTSGNFLELIEVRINCEQNSLLYLVRPVNGCGTCHTKNSEGKYRKSCYYRVVILENSQLRLKKKKGGLI